MRGVKTDLPDRIHCPPPLCNALPTTEAEAWETGSRCSVDVRMVYIPSERYTLALTVSIDEPIAADEPLLMQPVLVAVQEVGGEDWYAQAEEQYTCKSRGWAPSLLQYRKYAEKIGTPRLKSSTPVLHQAWGGG